MSRLKYSTQPMLYHFHDLESKLSSYTVSSFRNKSYQSMVNLNHTVKIDIERTREYETSLRKPFDNRPFSVKYHYK